MIVFPRFPTPFSSRRPPDTVNLAAAILAAGVGWALIPAPVGAQTIRPTELVLQGTLGPALAESSGIAVSRRQPGVLWTHNDSDREAVLYAVTLKGEVLTAVPVRGARNRDWEDIALGPCLLPVRDQDCLYVGDTGDNSAQRAAVDVYIVTEPNIPGRRRADAEAPAGAPAQTERATRIRLSFLRGPTDVEAVAVSPAGDLVLVSKGRRGRPEVYVVERRTLQIAAETGETVTLRSTGTLDIQARSVADLVTGAAFSPSGSRLVVRTYRDLYFYRPSGSGFRLDGPPCRMGAAEPQGEAVDFLTEERLVLSSESLGDLPATIYTVKCN